MVYRNNLKNREFGKEAAEILESGASDIVREQGASEDPKFRPQPTWPKTDSSSCFGINWEEQWACFAHRFENGKAHIDLPNGTEIELLPGPGFGDFSHPTTQLMIELMAGQVRNEPVFDIGCGSGILSVAAAKMGAKSVYACDIDPNAIAHTVKNGELNGARIEMNRRPSGRPVILMNMIQSEQEIAWNSHGRPFSKLITSGILSSDLDNYMIFAQKNSWRLVHKMESAGWAGFIFEDIK